MPEATDPHADAPLLDTTCDEDPGELLDPTEVPLPEAPLPPLELLGPDCEDATEDETGSDVAALPDTPDEPPAPELLELVGGGAHFLSTQV